MADFKQAFNATVTNEGGYVNDPSDSGGETYMGISRRNFPKWPGWVIIDSIPGKEKGERWSSLQSDVEAFYKSTFWAKIRGDEINSMDEAKKLYDSAVLNGIIPAIKMMQQAIGVIPNGVVDVITLNKLNNQNPYNV